MKKLLVTAIGAVVAVNAFAGQISQQRFKEVATDPITKDNLTNILNSAATPAGTYWSDPVDITNEYTVSATSLSNPGSIDALPVQALDIKTKFGKPLSLNIVSGGTTTNIPSSGLYFDALVKFTVCDEAPSADQYDGAKIIMWLQENEAQTETNLYVRAGYLSKPGNNVVSTPTNYVCAWPGNDIDINGLNRVTIKAIADITSTGRGVPGFAIYINQGNDSSAMADINSTMAKWDSTFPEDELSEAAEMLNLGRALFPTLDLTSGDKSSLRSVAFDGTGSITDIVFTDDAPAYARDMATEKATVVNENEEPIAGSPFTDLAAAVAALNAGSLQGGTYTMTLSRDVAVSDTLAFASQSENDVEVVIDFNGCVITYNGSGAAISNAGTLTIKDSSGNKTGGIVCPEVNDTQAAAVMQMDAASLLTIAGGNFWGDFVIEDLGGTDMTISGGAFQQEGMVLGDLGFGIAEGKKISETQNANGLYEVVNIEYFTIKFVYGADLATTNTYEVAEGDTPTAPDAATVAVAGKTFTGWDATVVPAVADATYTAVYEAVKVNVIFVDGDTATTNKVDYGTTLTAESAPAFVGRTGYTAAWDKTVAGTTVTAETTFTAVYTGKTFTIVTYTNDVVNTSKEFTYAGVSVAPADPLYNTETETWDGKWYTTDGGSTEFAFNAAGELTQIAYATIETKGGSVVPDIPAGGETDCGTAEAAEAAADAINKDAASKAAHIVKPSTVGDGAAATTYYSYVEAKAVGTKVTVDFTTAGEAEAQTSANNDVVSEAVSAAVAAAAAAGSEGSGTASVSTVAGFYYSIVSGTSPTAVTTEGTRVLGTGGSVNLTVPNKGPAGFYKVKVSARAAD